MRSRVPNNPLSERRLEKATKHVTIFWFPINPSILEDIRARFRNGAFNENIEALLEALKRDFALFTFIVKELMPMATNERVSRDVTNNPAELLRWAGPERIRKIIFDDQILPSNHVFNSIEPFQADRLRETAIIASTAEVLSEKHNLDPETGFCRGVIREIGLNLIAWNYPSLYSRVVKSLHPNRTLDEELTAELGFSPSLLAMRVLRPDAMIDGSDDSFEQTWATYDQLCEVGEALARAENPATYPSAENDWRLASAYLEKTVGAQGIDLIKSRAIEHSREYQRSLVGSFQPLQQFDPAMKLENYRHQQNALRNRYLQHCSPGVQNALKDLYAEMVKQHTLGQVLERLFRGIIPEAGFTGGCVFVVDPASFALKPRTVFGKVRLRALEQVALRRDRSGIQETGLQALAGQHGYVSDSAATALSCSQPVIERPEDDAGAALTGMYGSLGETRRIGVLYLELPEGPDLASDAQSLGKFKAVRQALSDALHLE